MNARILRKWSIQTNLMSSTVYSLLVVVALLLVTCAPISPILATIMNAHSVAFTVYGTYAPSPTSIQTSPPPPPPPPPFTTRQDTSGKVHTHARSPTNQGIRREILRNIGDQYKMRPSHYTERSNVGDTETIDDEKEHRPFVGYPLTGKSWPLYAERTTTLGTASSATLRVVKNIQKSVANNYNTEHWLSGSRSNSGGVSSSSLVPHVNFSSPKLIKMPMRYVIESYEVPASLPLNGELTEKQRRMLIHEQYLRQLHTIQQQQAARNRRESLNGSFKRYVNDQPKQFQNFRKRYLPQIHHNIRQQQHQQQQQQQQHQQQQQQQQRLRKHTRRYCSARDPAQLAFEAPTVFEGKIVSMTPDRRSNFSATVEVREIFKQQIGFHLQKYLRLQFAYGNSSGECDIYREQLRLRGLVRGDTIEPGRIYLLFVQQIDNGNFTILGQPIRRTRRVVDAVRNAVSENYVFYIWIPVFAIAIHQQLQLKPQT
uniref:Vein beta-barrel domain-containing protein n=1 Tax=Glossina palpalis gambiensis TaxID=67801 RepID=A0A1B0BRR2_9MUSC